MGAAGTSGDSLNVEDVFSTFLYTGDTSAADDSQTLTTGIDLANEGGLLWIACRSAARGHTWVDTAQNTNLSSASPRAGATSHSITTTSTGFTLGNGDASYNNGTTPDTYCAWSFRKAPKFFDVVTYTGNGSARSIAHSLGSTPGMIIVKQINGTYSWRIWHRSLGNTKYLRFQTDTAGADNSYTHWSNGAHTDSIFRVGTNVGTNEANATYVAYLFAHNDDDGGYGSGGDQDIIKCGTFEGDSATVSLGFEPQWILLKNVDANSHWKMYDIMRGLPVTTGAAELAPHSSDAETNIASSESIVGSLKVDTDGFSVSGGFGSTYIYVAIRFPNMATITDATEVFAVDTIDATQYDSGFPVDMAIYKDVGSGANPAGDPHIGARLLGTKELDANGSAEEGAVTALTWDSNTGFFTSGGADSDKYGWMWKRAKGYFDVVTYAGTGSAKTEAHSLGVVPEMMWVKVRNESQRWNIYFKGGSMDATDYLILNATNAPQDSDTRWNDTDPTSSVFTVGTSAETNTSGDTYIAFLFASLAGVSKVGTVVHSGSSTDVDCGFSAGARFVLLKSISTSGDWYVWDSTRGIIAGNDPVISLNNRDAQQTDKDWIDPLASGFNINGAGDYLADGTYLFYAVA